MALRLEFGFEWDRDTLLHLASAIRQTYWPLSVFIILPTVLYVLVYKTQMDRDCKCAFIVHNVVMACFDVYSGLFYQLYTLLPYPVFCCTGLLCDEQNSPRALLTILAFWTIAMCVPYLFVMMRIHQKMLAEDSILKLSLRSQAVLIFLHSSILVSNVYGFAAWSVESSEKAEILEIPSLAWAKSQSRNFLVLGGRYGDIGLFGRVFRISKQFKSKQRSRTYQLQLRFMIWMSIQAFFTCIMFILPLAFLFLFMVTPLPSIIPVMLMAPFRVSLMVMYSCCSIGHSTVFLLKSAWFMQTFGRVMSQSKVSETRPKPCSTSTSNTLKNIK